MKLTSLNISRDIYPRGKEQTYTAAIGVENSYGSTSLKLSEEQAAEIVALVADQIAANVTSGLHDMQQAMLDSIAAPVREISTDVEDA